MTTPESLFSLRLALVSSMLEARIASSAGARVDTASAMQAALRQQIAAYGDDVPATWLGTRAELSRTEEDVLWLLVAAETVPSVRGLVATLTGATELTASTIAEVVYGDAPSLVAHRELTHGRLARLELMQRTDGGDNATPDFRRALRAHPRVVALCLGDTSVANELERVAALSQRDTRADNVVVTAGGIDRTRSVMRDGNFIVAVGRRGTGRTSLLDAVARERGYRVLVVEGSRLSQERSALLIELHKIAREARLLDAAVLLRDLDALGSDVLDIIDHELLRELVRPCLATATIRPARAQWCRTTAIVELSAITGEQRAALWSRAIPTAAETDAKYLASTYPFAPAVIHAVGHALASLTSLKPSADEVIGCIDTVVDQRVGSLADRVTTSQTWDDVVLPDDQFGVVQAIIARVRQRDAVYETWGFATKLGKGLGVTALMSGPPGTGKTMTAALIAKELGLPLFQVDLSKIVSKWIGETEKHLGALFDAAEAGRAILLFDEADSLFGKRTDVKSSNDRHANLEVNFLLQRIERFSGICFLTTNHENAMDEAFRRRLSFHLRFAVPELEERVELWRRMLPPQAPVAQGVDFETLARKLSMSGGYIRNAVLRAAFAACDEGSPITMSHLWNAGVAEYEAIGKIASGL
jgi:ATP-dependent 26S proteasome regulatory subunit